LRRVFTGSGEVGMTASAWEMNWPFRFVPEFFVIEQDFLIGRPRVRGMAKLAAILPAPGVHSNAISVD
jgi:hypothetical protein